MVTYYTTDKLLQIILQNEAPEAIFQIAKATIHHKYENIFFNVPETTDQPDAYLLLVVIDTDSKQCTQIQSSLETKLQQVASVTCWCMSLSSFNEQLQQGLYFASAVFSHAERLYMAKDAGFAGYTVIKGNRYEGHWYERAREFYAGAELYVVRKQYAMAAFHLHQCAEQALTSVVYNKCGYRPATHNLLLLYRYAGWFEPLLHGLFTSGQLKEDSLLHLLQRAYTGSRYTNEYAVKGLLIQQLKDKMQQLLSITKATCYQNIIHETAEN